MMILLVAVIVIMGFVISNKNKDIELKKKDLETCRKEKQAFMIDKS